MARMLKLSTAGSYQSVSPSKISWITSLFVADTRKRPMTTAGAKLDGTAVGSVDIAVGLDIGARLGVVDSGVLGYELG